MRFLVIGLALGFATGVVAQVPRPLRVRASAVTVPCVEVAATAYRRATGRGITVEAGAVTAPDSGAGFDVVVGADEELTRVIEGGSSQPDLDVDVARLPWVLVGAQGGAAKLSKSSGARVRVVDGPVGLEARAWLRKSGQVAQASTLLRGGLVSLAQDEVALVPASLAGGTGTAVDVPPVVVRAVGMRASSNATGVAQFLAWVEKGPGNEAFCDCGKVAVR
jgi:hypothetical protein